MAFSGRSIDVSASPRQNAQDALSDIFDISGALLERRTRHGSETVCSLNEGALNGNYCRQTLCLDKTPDFGHNVLIVKQESVRVKDDRLFITKRHPDLFS